MVLDRIINRKIQDSKSTNRIIAASKAVTWRIVGTLDTWVISYLVTGKATLAFSIASIEVFTKMVLYYFHERGWEAMKRKVISKQEDLE
ncbi:MAG TPA: DUF2061 domain-containing protein [Cyclobacteriaceae bacterium]|nr:DUF2061 domain-containing protein [Cyclobacteriaceae bacterium]